MRPIDRNQWLSMAEVNALQSYCRHHANPLVWLAVDLALSTGLRVNELARIRIEHLDFQRGTLQITRAKKKEPKPESLALGADLLDHIKTYLAYEQRFQGPLLVGQRGPLTRHGLQQLWDKAVHKANLPHLSIHGARHTLAVHLLRRTGNLRQVQKQLGHSSPATTANMYADVPFEDMQKGVTGLYRQGA